MKSKTLKAYLIYTAVLVVLALAAILYIRGLLVRYEGSQPEREVERQISLMKEAAEEGRLEEMIYFEDFKPEDEATYKAEIERFTKTVKKGNLTYHDRYAASGHSYDIKSGSETLARISLESIESERETKLIVFNFEKWKVTSIEPAIISGEIEMSSSLTLKINKEVVEGTPAETAGYTKYSFSRLTTPEIVVHDLAGKSTVYDPTKNMMTYGYKIMMPSNYTLSADGLEVDPSNALSVASDDFKDIIQYCPEVPTDLTYDLVFINNNVDFTVTDNSGNEIDYKMENRRIEIKGQSSAAPVPEDLAAQINVLDVAQKWSLFMTNDLQGGNRGYNTISQYLIKDSYLDSVAKKWANGIDITFTSIHTLGNPPFVDEVVTDYARYSEDCFSCSISFVKHMNLNSGKTVMDPLDSTFYFVNVAADGAAPDWRIASIRANVNDGGESVE